MKYNKFTYIFFLGFSSLIVGSSTNEIKKSTLAVVGIYSSSSLLNIITPGKSSSAKDFFTVFGLAATTTAVMVNNDAFSTVVGAGLVASDLYARYQYKK